MFNKICLPEQLFKKVLTFSALLGGVSFITLVADISKSFAQYEVEFEFNSITFSSLLERGSDGNALAFNGAGDLYFIGWEAGLERAAAQDLPDGSADLLLPMQTYLPFFGQGALEVIDINGAGITVDDQGRVISYFGGVFKDTEGNEGDKVGFVRCNPDGSDFTPIPLTAGEAIPSLGYEVGDAFGVFPPDHPPNQMVLTTHDGVETLLFTVWGVPAILQAPAEGGLVTVFRQYEENGGFPGALTLMDRVGEKSLVFTYNDGSVHKINLVSSLETILAVNSDFVNLLGAETSATARFGDIDYEPVSDTLYITAEIWWDFTIPLELIALSPAKGTLSKVIDVSELTTLLSPIRTPQYGAFLYVSSVFTNPAVIAAGQSSLFLSDYWSGLEMIRMDFSPPPVDPIPSYDVDGNGAVNFDDVSAVIMCRNKPAEQCPDADVDGDGRVTVLDARKVVLSCDRPGCAKHECFNFTAETSSLDVSEQMEVVSIQSFFEYTAGADHSTSVFFDLYLDGSFYAEVGPVPVGGVSAPIALPLVVGPRLIELRNVACSPGDGSCIDGSVSSWGGTVCITP